MILRQIFNFISKSSDFVKFINFMTELYNINKIKYNLLVDQSSLWFSVIGTHAIESVQYVSTLVTVQQECFSVFQVPLVLDFQPVLVVPAELLFLDLLPPLLVILLVTDKKLETNLTFGLVAPPSFKPSAGHHF